MNLRRRAFFCTICSLVPVWAGKKSNAKGPEVELLDHTVKVEDGRVMLDGHVKNVGEKPIRRLKVIYEVLDSDKKVLTRQKGAIDQDTLDRGEDAAFAAQMQYHARAVYYRFEFEDGAEKELRSENTGPFPLE